jgi:hypothetical protein
MFTVYRKYKQELYMHEIEFFLHARESAKLLVRIWVEISHFEYKKKTSAIALNHELIKKSVYRFKIMINLIQSSFVRTHIFSVPSFS